MGDRGAIPDSISETGNSHMKLGTYDFDPEANRSDVLVQELAPQAYDDAFDVFVRVRRSGLSAVRRIEDAGRRPDVRGDSVGFAPLLSNCDAG